MTLTERQLAVLKQFHIVDAHGAWINVRLVRPEDKPLGDGPKVRQDVVRRFFDLDTTNGQIWLEWTLHQAAGGDRARESSVRAMDQMKQRFMDERLHGYQHARTREIFPPIEKEAAGREWESGVKQQFEEVLMSSDQDAVEKLGVWGFFRDWPGNQGIYQKVYEVFKAWLELQPRLAEMNQELERDGKPLLATKPADVSDLENMESLCKKVVRYFASKVARDDVRLATWKGNSYIYSDDSIIVTCPLTYAASVRYGCDAWSFSNRDSFERLLLDENNFADNWGGPTQKGVYWAFIHFKCPMPRWVARRNNQFQVHELTNLAVELRSSGEAAPYTFIDEEGQSKVEAQVREMITHELTRPDDPADGEMPVKRGPNVFTTRQEVESVLYSLNCAMKAVAEWSQTFDTNRVKVKPLDYPKETKPTAEPPAGPPS